MSLHLDFDRTRKGDLVAHAGRYLVRIVHDYDAMQPHEFSDVLEPVMVAGNFRRGMGKPDIYGDWPTERELFDGITRAQMKRLCSDLAEMIDSESRGYLREDYAPVSFYREARERAATGESFSMAVELFEIALNALYSHDPIPAWKVAFDVMGWPYLETESRGYCQGDYAKLLTVASPAFRERVGLPLKHAQKSLEATAKEWGFWAWGDVYGYIIETESGDHIDSCFGFYTDEPENESHLLEAIAEGMPGDWQIDSDIGPAAIYCAA